VYFILEFFYLDSYSFGFVGCILKVAFLASAVGPRVAATCAHAALASLSGNNSGSTAHIEAVENDNR